MTGVDAHRPHVVIVGGGFAGLNAARALRRAPVRVTVVDRENHHLFQPLLYQVATAALNPSDIAHPLRAVLRRQRNARVLLAEVRRVELGESRLILDNGILSYDFLILATGATHAYFGHPEWESVAPGLKSVDDALEIRRRVLLAYEAAERESGTDERRAWLRFAVVGGGPTGVELAGALAEIGHHALSGDFRAIDPGDVEVLLLEGQDRILTTFPPGLAAKAERQLTELGVHVRTGAFVTGLDPSGLRLGDEFIPARTVLWAAGVRASSLAGSLDVPKDPAGRVMVEPDLTIPGQPNVYVAGDLASIHGVPGVCPAAIQQGRYAARAIRASLDGNPVPSFRYRDKGSLATIGRARAVGAFGPVRLAGFPAWLAWLGIHIFFLIGFRNRLWVTAGWAWSWLTFRRGARLITQRSRHPQLPRVEAGPSRAPQPAEPPKA